MSQEFGVVQNLEPSVENNVPHINVFEFIKNPEKLKKLINANELLNINKHRHNKLIFVYSSPKVGSTSIVSSFRIFGIERVDTIHIHDEEMLHVLANIKDVTVNEIILFNRHLGKDVYVINVYRSPIERKISTFFEKIGSHHFNAEDFEVNKYNVTKVINRFNNIFPWIGNGDHFIDKYNINIPDKFDNVNKYLLVNQNGIKYITLRLKDSDYWGSILTSLFGFNIKTIKDYESSAKPIKDLYDRFKLNYKIPINLLNLVINDRYLKYYYTNEEINKYHSDWLSKATNERTSYTCEEYKLYETVCIENCHIDKIQLDHYFDEGCKCKACSIKRLDTIHKILNGIEVKDRIVHSEAKNQLIQNTVMQANKINNVIQQRRKKMCKKEMKLIVSKGVLHR